VSGGLSEEERLLQATAREFAERELAPTAIERDEAERYDRSLFAKMGELGLTAAPFAESVGGAGFSYLGWTLVMEELGAVDMAMAVSLSVHILSQYPVVTWGTPEQHARWLPPMLSGEALGAFALTEPHAGSDAAAIRARAERVGPADAPTGYRLTGTKIWISNAPEADRYLVFATLDPEAGAKGITAFLVEKGTPGFRFGAHERKMGIRACPAAELVFDGAEVPVANRLGAEGEGYRIALSALGEGRISIAARRASASRGPGWRPPRATSSSGGRSGRRSWSSRASGSCSPRCPVRWPRRGRSRVSRPPPRIAGSRSPRSRPSRNGPPRTRRCGSRPTPSSCSGRAGTRGRRVWSG
jgi:acyl-CoA dehydrogenase